MIKDLIKEFALLCQREGVMKNFAQITSNHPDYAALLNELTVDETPPLFPEITGFVFGLDPDVANDSIRNMQGPFMLIDYGLFNGSNVFDTGGSNIEFVFSCIIAMPPNARNLDAVEDMLWRDTILQYCRRMLKHFEQRDRNTCAVNRMLNGTFTIAPVNPLVLLNCIGWDVSFSKNASSMLF